jgi:hypothetical protein
MGHPALYFVQGDTSKTGGEHGAALVQAFELGGGLEVAVEMAVDDLHEEFA